MAAVGLLITGSGTAWADDATYSESINLGTAHTKSTPIEGTSFTISGTYVAEYISSSQFRLRCQTTAGTFSNASTITVKDGYTINSVTISGVSVGDAITLKGVYVDDDTENNLLSETVTYPKSGTKTAVSKTISDLNATKAIYIVTGGEAVQLSASISVTYTRPTDAKDVTVTWALSSGKYEEATISADDVFCVSGFTARGHKLNSKNTDCKLDGNTFSMTKFRPISSQASDYVLDHSISFDLTPQKGITFVPTKVSFYMTKLGTGAKNTDNSTVFYLQYSTAIGSTNYIIETNKDINRPGSSHNGTEASAFSKSSVWGAASFDDPFSLILYVKGIATTKDVAIGNVQIEGYYYGTAEETTTYSVASAASPTAGGVVEQVPGATSIVSGNSLSFTATANNGYIFSKWVNKDNEEVSSKATYTIESVDADVNVTAKFIKLATVTYAKEDDVEGTVPDVNYCEDGKAITLKKNYNLYKEGYTFSGWNDTKTTYAPGASYSTTEDVTLTAVFTANEKTLADLIPANRTSDIIIDWSFDSSNDGPSLNFEGKNGIYVLPAEINGTTIDLKMDIEASSGKCNNVGRTSVQLNSGTNLKFSALAGAVINVVGATLSKSTINDVAGAPYASATDGDITIAVKETIYPTKITVTYPQNIFAVSDINAATLCLPIAVKIPKGVKAYTGVLSDNTLTLTEVEDIIPANEAVVLVGDAATYTFELSESAGTKAEKNDLVGNSTSSEIKPSVSKATVCVLDKVNNELGFYKWTGKIPAYKAYLAVPNATTEETSSSAPEIRVVFNDEPGNVTAIESIAAEAGENAPIYTLSGRQVKGIAAPGLYIQGGKKILVK
jgi:uncharacterized repeat protein (TIGR02543 family)